MVQFHLSSYGKGSDMMLTRKEPRETKTPGLPPDVTSSMFLKFEDIDVDLQFEVASKYGVRSVPLVVIERDGVEIHRFSGVQSALTYRNAINESIK